MAPLPTEAFCRVLPALNTQGLHKLSALATLALLIDDELELLAKWEQGRLGYDRGHRADHDLRRPGSRIHRRRRGEPRQVIAIARAIHFNVRCLIMDEPTAALGPAETAMVGELIKQLRQEGVGIFLISHDLHDVRLRPPALRSRDAASG